MASSHPGPVPRTGKCPICKGVVLEARPEESDPHYRPFCSRRCADVDLSRWLGGGYAIAGAGADADDDGDDNALSREAIVRPGGESDEDA